MQPVLINGQTYAWQDIEVVLLGRKVYGIRAISYSETQEFENIYGAGNQVVARGTGIAEFEGAITLLSDEVEKIMDAIPSGRLQDIPEFPITVHYRTSLATKKVTHTLLGCRFKNNVRDVSQGDNMIEVELDIAIAGIAWRATGVDISY